MIDFEEFRALEFSEEEIKAALADFDWDSLNEGNVNTPMFPWNGEDGGACDHGTMAHIIARLGTAEDMQKLLAKGADLGAEDHDYLTPLVAAQTYDNSNKGAIIELLLGAELQAAEAEA